MKSTNLRLTLSVALLLTSTALLAQKTNTHAPSYGQRARTTPNTSVSVASGTEIQVRTDQAIDVKENGPVGAIYPASIAQDVLDQNGKIAIPQDARAQLRVIAADSGGKSDGMTLALDSVTVNGQTYKIQTASTESMGSSRSGGIGKNKRTGEYVGGGAAVGAIIGAIAGGGKGAAIGAIAGGAAGGGVQVLTRGKELKVPAETLLNFRLEQDVTLHAYHVQPSSRRRLPK